MGRKIETKLFNYMFERAKGNGLLLVAEKEKNLRLAMAVGAPTLVGIKEKTGKNDGTMVELIQETVGGHNQEAYCMSTYQTILAFAELVTGINSPLLATEHCQTLYNHTKKNFPELMVKKIPLPGACAIWGDVGKQTGHAECVLSADEKDFHCVGGNTSGSMSPTETVNRDGNGVYFTTRGYGNTPKRRLMGFVKPI